MHRIFPDTNFLIKCIEWKIDFFSEFERVCDFAYDVVLLDCVLDELAAYGAEGGKKKETANVALLVLSKKPVKTVHAGGHADDALVKLATKHDVVATQDQELKRRLKEKGVPVVVIREKGYLELVGR
ncbi:MAG TPA: PIN domain-containing protein [Candidatus Binatia bacterium]|nr:PIN domain-containing protein [Candidatus Binatia bacterium]